MTQAYFSVPFSGINHTGLKPYNDNKFILYASALIDSNGVTDNRQKSCRYRRINYRGHLSGGAGFYRR